MDGTQPGSAARDEAAVDGDGEWNEVVEHGRRALGARARLMGLEALGVARSTFARVGVLLAGALMVALGWVSCMVALGFVLHPILGWTVLLAALGGGHLIVGLAVVAFAAFKE